MCVFLHSAFDHRINPFVRSFRPASGVANHWSPMSGLPDSECMGEPIKVHGRGLLPYLVVESFPLEIPPLAESILVRKV